MNDRLKDRSVRPEPPQASSAAARKVMQGNRGRDTRPELAVRRAAHRRGLRYRVDVQPLPNVRRRADLVFPRERIAVFIDGCYWHGCPEHYKAPSANAAYWSAKIATNVARDQDTNSRLAAAGWRVIRAWEHESAEAVADRLVAARIEVAHEAANLARPAPLHHGQAAQGLRGDSGERRCLEEEGPAPRHHT
ncbi:very short patch repair endonuclease [Micromonospora tulbaghiae]|uniref:very short patch repair endonuclease n=1 Tax=Micromonospora tulbaghiae TaxID=479978 RepID=UPI003EBE38B1